MTRRRRAIGLLGLAILLGGLAASSVRRREAALDHALGPLTTVLVTRAPIHAGAPLAGGRPALRTVPRRYAPPDAVASAARLTGAHAAVPLPAGTYVTAATLRTPAAAGLPAVGPGERVADVVAHGDARTVVPGTRVDVLVTREARGNQPGATVLALEDVEVLAAAPAPQASGDEQPGDRVTASLRVTVRQAVYLAAAQSFARELRLLARAPTDRARGRTRLATDERLR